MSELNSQHNVSVWLDIPVIDLARAVGQTSASGAV